MTESTQIIAAFESRAKRREERRDFFKNALSAMAIGAAGATVMSWTTAAEAQTLTDADILNFALNLEYLEAQFYSYAAYGTPLAASVTGGGAVAPTATGARRVDGLDADPVVRDYAREIAADEIAHVTFLRNAIAGAGATPVAQPQIDIGISPTGAFSSAARAAGLIGPTTAAAPTFFDPYSSPNNFLLGAFIFEDVGVTAYKGAAPLITNKTFLEASAGILAVEAYHASIIRTVLYARGMATPSLRSGADAISNARDSLDGATDIDQGISPVTQTATTSAGANQSVTTSNIVPLDANGIAYDRTPGQVLNIVYLTKTAASAGGFFPAGTNGTIKMSTAQPA